MQLISVNVGQPRTLSWRGRDASTGIFKSPVAGPVMARHHNLDGDRWRVGAAEVMVTEPRMPCYKLGLKFGRADMVKRFLASRRTGFYLAIVQPGLVAAGHAIEVIHRDPHGVSVAEITRVYAADRGDAVAIRRLLEVDALPEGWRSYLEQQLAELL